MASAINAATKTELELYFTEIILDKQKPDDSSGNPAG